MDEAAQGVVHEAVQHLLSVRQSIDQLIAECLGKLQGTSAASGDLLEDEGTAGVNTPPAERLRKRPRDTPESEADSIALHPGTWPCRVDLSHLASLLMNESVQHYMEVENRLAGKKQKLCYPYGNYPHYYSYRLEDFGGKDPRIEVLHKEWFCGKDCLDVGSHQGVLTLAIVTEFTPRSMMGVEIDEVLCKKAQGLRSQLMKKHRGTQVGVSLRRTEFWNGDFLEMATAQEASFDVVTCLSVSKWIHFHHGDAGMQQLFRRFWKILRLNGLLLFEPQSLKSYRQAMKKLDVSCIPHPVSELQFSPEEFLSYLTDEVGFEHVQTIDSESVSKGFERPIYLLKKRRRVGVTV